MNTTPWPGVYREGRELFTRNAGPPGDRVYGERIRLVDAVEYRTWDPFRSKLAALLEKGGLPAGFGTGISDVLYLGGAHGTTVSHLSDLLPQGRIFAVEKSPTAFAPLLALARRRTNIYPIFADGQLPERYLAEVGRVDLLYQDVAQRQQAAIFLENAEVALRPSGRGILMLKVRSVTQRRPSAAIVREARATLGAGGLRVEGEVTLSPFARDHVALTVRPA